MNSAQRWLAWGLALAALSISAQGCGEDPGKTTGGSGGHGAAPPAPKPAGGLCSCDADCEGDTALCMLGMCMKRANGLCATQNAEAGCEPGFRCFNTDILTDTGVCFPLFDPALCEGVENRDGLCSPIRGEGCDAACGVACTPDTIEPTNAGAACGADEDCSFADAACYSDAGSSTPNGWVEGYCLSFGCDDDSQCGPEAGCYPVATDGSGVCMNTCGVDLDCRPGYICKILDEGAGSVCYAGCDAAATCPVGYACVGDICVSDDIACSTANPFGYCPEGSWCDAGTCNEQPFACGGAGDALEPNDSLAAAVPAPAGTTQGLTICDGDNDWYEIVVPAHTLVRVGIQFQNAGGDLDLVVYDGAGALIGARYGDQYPYLFRDQETNTEYYGFYSEQGGAKYYVRAIGYKKAQNVYSLHVDAFPYQDGPSCVGAGFTSDECTGIGDEGSGLLPFPFADPNDSVVGAAYVSETFSNYRFARRELIMLVRDALSKTLAAFPGTTTLSLIDICQIDGITPGYDVGVPRHPESTHDQGGNIDIAYFQTDGSNDGTIICGDGSQHEDGWCSPAAAQKHIVDLERQAFFMAKLFTSPRTRVIGVDQVIAPLIADAAAALFALPNGDPKKITSGELASFSSRMAYGSGWPYHHHHIHLSMNWWTGQTISGEGAGAQASSRHDIHRTKVAAPQRMTWPPRP